MRTSPFQLIRRHAAIACLAIVLPVVACGDASEPFAPSMPEEQEQHQVAGTVITYPASALAEFPISLRLGDVEVEGSSVEWIFSDGTRQRGSRVTKSFPDSGLTTVNVRVTDENGLSYGFTRVIEVGPSIASLATTLTGINPGGLHNCAIDATQSLYCWGYNGNGNIGDGTTTDRMAPTLVGAPGSFAQVSTGFAHSCALTTAGVAYCWGRNYDGQLGDGSFTDRATPTLVQGGLTFTSIDVGYDHSCAITESGAAYCWGSNTLGQLGDGQIVTRSNVPRAVAGALSYSMVRAGYLHSCAIQTTTGFAYCWGSNRMGQVGVGLTADSLTVPSLVSGGNVFTQLDAGGYHTCGVTATRTYCWGWNGSGQLGASTNTTCGTAALPCARVPVRLNSSLRFIGVSTGTAHSCAVESTGDLHCWGHNANGQLGDGTTTSQSMAKKVQISTVFKTVSARGSFTCGVSLDNQAYCWGSNQNGKLGLGDTVDRLVPTVVPNLSF
jgi:alpha-tubulin suppressor-like RCC1 family protein